MVLLDVFLPILVATGLVSAQVIGGCLGRPMHAQSLPEEITKIARPPVLPLQWSQNEADLVGTIRGIGKRLHAWPSIKITSEDIPNAGV